MFLKKCIYVNWGNIPQLEFEFGPINLLSGGNGSGKTTAADAIQTIMTAAHENLFQYNPGQDETTQRGRGGKRVRTLASYVLGCDDGSYARLDPTDGYLAALFYPTKGETAEPFAAVIGVRAWLDQTGKQAVARQDDSPLFMILTGEKVSDTLGLTQFVKDSSSGKQITAMDKIQTTLIAEYGNSHVEKYDTKKAYLRRLYGVLRGRSDSVTELEAVAAARAFSRFMAYKPVQSINRFVADEILEKRDLGEAIRSIASQLKTIHGMERDAAQLVESIDILGDAKQYGQLYIENWIELNTLNYSIAKHHYLTRQHEYLQAKQKQRDLQTDLKTNASETELARERRQQLHNQLVTLEAQRIGISALQQKDELEKQRDQEHKVLTEQARQLLLEDNWLADNVQNTHDVVRALSDVELVAGIPQATDLNTVAAGKELLSQGDRGDIDFQALLGRDLTGDLSALENHLDQARTAQRLHNQWFECWHGRDEQDESLRGALDRLMFRRESRYEQLNTQQRTRRHEIERLEAHEVNYPVYVDRAIAEIKRLCPQADPRVLCDHIEVKDPQWQSAIEGYLGGARFSIIVTPETEAEAIRIVRNMQGRDNRARIIQGSKAQRDALRIKLDGDSIIHVLEFSHATARDYVSASYGSVLRVDSADELRNTRRGLTADGMGAGNYSMYRCDMPDSALVFGAAARERALKAKQQELAALTEEWQSANDAMQTLSQLLVAVDNLKPLEYADTITRMLSTHRELQKIENLLAQLDLSDHEELETRLQDLRNQEKTLAEQEAGLNENRGKLQGKLESTSKRCKELNEQQDSTEQAVEQCEQNLRDISSEWTEFDTDARLLHADNEAKDLNTTLTEKQIEDLRQRMSRNEREMDRAIQNHNQHCRPSDGIVYRLYDEDNEAEKFRRICVVHKDIDLVFNQLKNNILVEKHQQLGQLRETFNSAFVTHLCHSIHQAINDGERQIRLLNEELTKHHFGADQETFRFASEPIPEFKDYARFFNKIINNPNIGDSVTLFDIELDMELTATRDKLMSMLLDEDEQNALRELERIADYRNYRRYEIYKDVEGKPSIALSEYGTGSGGQLETPAYIIRSAAITSAFRFSEGVNHLRMVLVDEAFSKMDETRSREVINYLTEALGLQLVFIMPTSKCGPFMDLISNEFVFAKCASEKPRGELLTRVYVDRKRCNQEKIKDLWANHRRIIQQQGALDFMEDVVT